MGNSILSFFDKYKIRETDSGIIIGESNSYSISDYPYVEHIYRFYDEKNRLTSIQSKSHNVREEKNVFRVYTIEQKSFEEYPRVVKAVVTFPTMEKRFNELIPKRYEGHLDPEKQKIIWKEYESKYGTMIKETEVEPLKVVTTDTYKGFPVYDIGKS